MIFYRLLKTSWGIVAYAARDHKLIRVFLPPDLPGPKVCVEKQKEIQLGLIGAMEKKLKEPVKEDSKLLPELAEELRAYFDGSKVKFSVKADLSDFTAFTRSVLERTAKIPYGKTVSYGELATLVKNPNACRAVAQALGSNPIPLIIPCHRVIQSDGKPGGFSGPCGPAFKVKLLGLEGYSFETIG